MTINNNQLNDILTDRFFKPKWLKYGYLGLIIAALGKKKVSKRKLQLGDDTFGGRDWSNGFYKCYPQIKEKSRIITMNDNNPYVDNNTHRYDRHVSLKLWLDYLGIK